MNLTERFKLKWNSLNKSEKSAVRVLLMLVLGLIIFLLGIEIGKTFFMVFGK